MYEDSRMRILIKLKYFWVLSLGALVFFSAILGAFIGASVLRHSTPTFQSLKGIVEVVGLTGFYIFVLGILLMVFFPYGRDRDKFVGYHKFMVSGFAIASFSMMFIPPILNLWNIGRLFSWVGVGLMLIGILRVRKKK